MNHYSSHVAWSDEDNAFVATSSEFPGLSGIGETGAAAISALDDAREVMVQAYRDDDEPIPEPKKQQTHSGKFVMRIPQSQHAELARHADREGTSLNTFVAVLISVGLGNYQALQRFNKHAA